MVFHRSLSDSKSPQVSTTLFSILADLIYAVVWMVFTCFLFFKSSFTNPLGIDPSVPFTISITVNVTFHSFLVLLIIISLFALL